MLLCDIKSKNVFRNCQKILCNFSSFVKNDSLLNRHLVRLVGDLDRHRRDWKVKKWLSLFIETSVAKLKRDSKINE
jgi:hypothetical protein